MKRTETGATVLVSFYNKCFELKWNHAEFPAIVNNEAHACLSQECVAENGPGMGADCSFVFLMQLCRGLLSK